MRRLAQSAFSNSLNVLASRPPPPPPPPPGFWVPRWNRLPTLRALAEGTMQEEDARTKDAEARLRLVHDETVKQQEEDLRTKDAEAFLRLVQNETVKQLSAKMQEENLRMKDAEAFL